MLLLAVAETLWRRLFQGARARIVCDAFEKNGLSGYRRNQNCVQEIKFPRKVRLDQQILARTKVI
jgi:hypothetical protein